jgi:hypothetical protein
VPYIKMIVLKKAIYNQTDDKGENNIWLISYFGIIDFAVGGRQKSNLIVCRLKTYQALLVYGREILPTRKCFTNTTNNNNLSIDRTASDGQWWNHGRSICLRALRIAAVAAFVGTMVVSYAILWYRLWIICNDKITNY